MQGNSTAQLSLVRGSSKERDEVARPLTPPFGSHRARFETSLAFGAVAVVLADIALWSVDGGGGSLVWLLYGVAVFLLSLALTVLVACRWRDVRFQAQASTTAKIGRPLRNGAQTRIRSVSRVLYSSWLFTERLREEIQRTTADGLTIGVIVVRIARGAALDAERQELVKAQVCSSARQGLRSRDIVGQLGEDEFALYLPETDRQAALVAGARLIGLLEEVAPGTIGVAAFPDDGGSAEELVDAARRRAVSYSGSQVAQPA